MTLDLPEGATTIEVESTVGSPGLPFWLTIDADDDDKREIVLVDASKDDDTFNLSTPDNRGEDGTSDVDHSAGALVGVYPVAALWTDANDRIDATRSDHDLHTHDGSDSQTVALADISGHGIAAHSDLHVPVGTIVMWPASDMPSRWLECDGSAVSRTTFSDLFAVVGTTFGNGDGSSTFNLPNFQDVLPIGTSATTAVGDTGGSETHTHTNPSTDSGGSHGHTQAASGSAGSHDHGGTGSAGGHAHTNPNTGTSGAHKHTQAGSTDSVSAHAHTNSSTGVAGGHGHGSAGSHAHSIGPGDDSTISFAVGSSSAVSFQDHDHNGTSSGGSHSHGSVSGHDHGVGNTGTNGGHSHGLSAVNSNGDHAHNQGNTGSNGGHAHGISSASNHTHTQATTDSGGGHTHTQADTGSASSLPPWLAVSFIIYAGT